MRGEPLLTPSLLICQRTLLSVGVTVLVDLLYRSNHGSEWSDEDWTGLVSLIRVQYSLIVEIRPTEQLWLLKLSGPGSVGLRGLGKTRVIEGEFRSGLIWLMATAKSLKPQLRNEMKY